MSNPSNNAPANPPPVSASTPPKVQLGGKRPKGHKRVCKCIICNKKGGQDKNNNNNEDDAVTSSSKTTSDKKTKVDDKDDDLDIFLILPPSPTTIGKECTMAMK